MRIVTHSAAETERLGERVAGVLRGGEVLALFGPMGMGKTAFTRGLARGLGVRGEVSSPTFALIHEHAGKIPLYHFDMFRVTSWDDLYSTGFFDYLGTGGVLVIEWSENIEGALPEDAVRISVSRGASEDERVFAFDGLVLPGEAQADA